MKTMTWTKRIIISGGPRPDLARSPSLPWPVPTGLLYGLHAVHRGQHRRVAAVDLHHAMGPIRSRHDRPGERLVVAAVHRCGHRRTGRRRCRRRGRGRGAHPPSPQRRLIPRRILPAHSAPDPGHVRARSVAGARVVPSSVAGGQQRGQGPEEDEHHAEPHHRPDGRPPGRDAALGCAGHHPHPDDEGGHGQPPRIADHQCPLTAAGAAGGRRSRSGRRPAAAWRLPSARRPSAGPGPPVAGWRCSGDCRW